MTEQGDSHFALRYAARVLQTIPISQLTLSFAVCLGLCLAPKPTFALEKGDSCAEITARLLAGQASSAKLSAADLTPFFIDRPIHPLDPRLNAKIYEDALDQSLLDAEFQRLYVATASGRPAPALSHPRDFYEATYRGLNQFFTPQRSGLNQQLSQMISKLRQVRKDTLLDQLDPAQQLALVAQIRRLYETINRQSEALIASAAGVLNRDGIYLETFTLPRSLGAGVEVQVPVLKISGIGTHELNLFANGLERNRNGPVELLLIPDNLFSSFDAGWNRQTRQMLIDMDTIASGQYLGSQNFQHQYLHLAIEEAIQDKPKLAAWSLLFQSFVPNGMPLASEPYGQLQAFDELATYSLETLQQLAELFRVVKYQETDVARLPAMLQQLKRNARIGSIVTTRARIATAAATDALRLDGERGVFRNFTGPETLQIHVDGFVTGKSAHDYYVDLETGQHLFHPRDLNRPHDITWDHETAFDHQHEFLDNLHNGIRIARDYETFFYSVEALLADHVPVDTAIEHFDLSILKEIIESGLRLETPVPINQFSDFAKLF